MSVQVCESVRVPRFTVQGFSWEIPEEALQIANRHRCKPTPGFSSWASKDVCRSWKAIGSPSILAADELIIRKFWTKDSHSLRPRIANK